MPNFGEGVWGGEQQERTVLERKDDEIVRGTEALYDVAAHNFPEMTEEIRSRYHEIAYKKVETEEDIEAKVKIGEELIASIRNYPKDKYPDQVQELIDYAEKRWKDALNRLGEVK
jgi:hypothetical protein